MNKYEIYFRNGDIYEIEVDKLDIDKNQPVITYRNATSVLTCIPLDAVLMVIQNGLLKKISKTPQSHSDPQ